jgi:hypothetical protein
MILCDSEQTHESHPLSGDICALSPVFLPLFYETRDRKNEPIMFPPFCLMGYSR